MPEHRIDEKDMESHSKRWLRSQLTGDWTDDGADIDVSHSGCPHDGRQVLMDWSRYVTKKKKKLVSERDARSLTMA